MEEGLDRFDRFSSLEAAGADVVFNFFAVEDQVGLLQVRHEFSFSVAHGM